MKTAIICSVFLVCAGAMNQQADAQCNCVPTVAYYAPGPTTAYYAAPVTAYYAPTIAYYGAPVTVYRAPAIAYRAPVATYYAPYVPYAPVYRRGLFGPRPVRGVYWAW